MQTMSFVFYCINGRWYEETEAEIKFGFGFRKLATDKFRVVVEADDLMDACEKLRIAYENMFD